MNFDCHIKRPYYSPELEFIIYNLEDTLTQSQPNDNDEFDWSNIELWEDNFFSDGGDANTDHNSIGGGDVLSGNDSDSDVNNDYYNAGDGDGLIN